MFFLTSFVLVNKVRTMCFGFWVFFLKCTFWTVVLCNLHGFEGVNENGCKWGVQE